ncbi:MAG: GUN4 domain-containing protein [Rhizonema sp. PD38]|nr:GUN4 domain-containing protein [Rhizonema sp. PD38]
MAFHYRLPEKEEINLYSINDDKQFSESGICLVKFQLPSKYSKLADYLWSGEWKKADEETDSVMLQVSNKEKRGVLIREDIQNFPCDDLRIIDYLWVYTSKGRFGFSVQKNIYQSLGGTSEYNEKVWDDFGDHVGWRVKESWVYDNEETSEVTFDTVASIRWIYYNEVTFNTTAPMGHLPVNNTRHVAAYHYTFSPLASRLVNCNISGQSVGYKHTQLNPNPNQ